ncbi:MAG: glycine cleavage system aminomethyltransferase GcvT [Anaerolineales bacterium]
MSDFLFRGNLEDLDPDVHELTQIEAERQFRKLILIPSESAAPLAVREALSSAFQNVYAEGYPPVAMRTMGEEDILDYETRLAEYRRYSDPRYYKGVEYANEIEALARRRCAQAFATEDVSPDDIYVNVQPLSGAPANNAVYHALVTPGDTVMGMDLFHGGHLSHGSPVNRSGKLYNIVHYNVDEETERIDYDQVRALAEAHQPKMIIAGYSSYPWSVDWGKFREIADSVGAYLLADIAHVAGLVAAGVYPTPIGFADVITFTTHKSLCGPRGAAILTTSPRLARLLDRAVFPGEQGGPHINTMAGQAIAFKLAMTDQFKALQRQIVENCVAFTKALEEADFRIPFGGTDTHLMNLDCRSIQSADGVTLSGDQAARILDIAGIVVNRNTIPGDRSALRPSGIRMGTSWITQRGFKEKETVELAGIIAGVLKSCTPYDFAGKKGRVTRAKVDFEALNQAKLDIRELATSIGIDFEPTSHGYPHFYYLDDALPETPYFSIELEGEHAEGMLRWITSSRPGEIAPGKTVETKLALDDGELVDVQLERGEDGETWKLILGTEQGGRVIAWLRDLSDGYVNFDPSDIYRKSPGPVVIHSGEGIAELRDTGVSIDGEDKPWFLGAPEVGGKALPPFTWDEGEPGETRQTALYDTHKAMGAKMVPFAGWEMPVWYTSVVEEHLATRQAAGLFDVSHMGVYQAEGGSACAFLDSVVANDVAALEIGESHYTQFLDPQGGVIDDAMVYRRSEDKYLVVVNASNDDKDWAWLNAVRDGGVRVDEARPWSSAFGRGCQLRNLRAAEAGEEMRVDIAIQGPKSREILLALGCEDADAERLAKLPWAGVMEGVFGGIDLVVSRTGYTGERVAFEMFVHPDKSVQLWQKLIEAGEPLGLLPVGLGARDSLRTEAGLPLYGHEMAGERALGVGDAGFAAYVKVYKPWFIGREAFMRQEAEREAKVTRFRFEDRGVRMAHYGDPVVDKRGKVIGFVTSCAVDSEGYLLGQAHLELKSLEPGTSIAVFQGASSKAGKALGEVAIGDRVTIPTPANVLTRFPR